MRTLGILFVAALVLNILPTTARAQCSALPAPDLCASIHVDFGTQKDIPKAPIRAAKPVLPTPSGMGRGPIDCGIVKHPDPNFRSAMPIVKQNPTIELPMKIVQAPACKG